MKTLLTAAAAVVISVALPLAAVADQSGQGRGIGRDKAEKTWKRESRDERKVDPRAFREGRLSSRDGPPPYRVHRTWRRGQVLPPPQRQAVIHDPYRYGLYAPPRGHAWVRVDNDVYLTQLGTGVIAEVLRDGL